MESVFQLRIIKFLISECRGDKLRVYLAKKIIERIIVLTISF